jgi:hypothetical protein
MKSIKPILCTALALVGMSAPLRADYLVNSFETTPVLYAAPSPPYPAVTQSSAWASDGSYSVAVTYDSSYTWSWLYLADPAGNNWYTPSTYANWYNYNKIQFDIYRPASNPSGNLAISAGINGSEGWNQVLNLVNYEWQNSGTAIQETVTWDYSAIRNAAPAPTASSWWQFNLVAQGGYGGTVYIDNLRFVDPVPEPSVFALLMLSLPLGMILRNRQALKN